MKAKDRLFDEIYKRDESTNRYMIEIALNQYSDIFDEWDPAPFKRRALDPDLELYLKGSSDEIPLRYPVEFRFVIPATARDQKMEEEVQIALKNSLAFKMYFLRKELKKTNIQVVRCILLGFLFLWLGAVFSADYDTGIVSFLAEALVIGGWVFLWEAVSLLFFTDHEIYDRYRMYKRLKNASVKFLEVDRLD